MKHWLLAATVGLFLTVGSGALASSAAAADASHGPPRDKATETADFILHHVADSEEFTLEVPGGHLFSVDLGQLFSGLVFETVPGACGLATPPSFAAFPSLHKSLEGCWDFRPTKAVLMMWVAFGLLLLVLALGRKRDSSGIPRGTLANLVEVLVLFVRDEIVVANLGKKDAARYTPYFLSLFFFVLFTNWLGLIPGFSTGTGVVTVTAALAILTFLLTQIASIRSAGLGGFLKHLTGGVPPPMWIIMIPVEILGLFTKPFALLMRLFANMVGGHLVLFFLLSLIFVWHPAAAVLSVALDVPILMLEIFVGILQAYLFTYLSALFVGQGIAMGHHHDEQAHAEGVQGHGH